MNVNLKFYIELVEDILKVCSLRYNPKISLLTAEIH